MESIPDIVPFRDRCYRSISTEKIKVINSRDRDQEQFNINVESIDHVGLLKPVRVNDKFLERTGCYELICGEGRLLAHQRLGRTEIIAEIVTCSRKEAYLQSLVENIARTKPGSMDFARELKRLHDEGWSYERIGRVACKSESYIRQYITLVKKGEDRLIRGVEQGIFPIAFAIQVAGSDNGKMQTLLMDAFDEGLVSSQNFAQARKIISARSRAAKSKSNANGEYTVQQLKHDIEDATRVKTSYVREAKGKENRFMTLLTGIVSLWSDAELLQILTEEHLQERPELVGDFRYEA